VDETRLDVLGKMLKAVSDCLLGVVGESDDTNNQYYIYSHKKFEFGFNGNQIVDVNMTTENKVLLTPSAKIAFSYEILWKKSSVKFEDRFDKYLDPNFFQHRIHWFSIFNSFMMVIFLVGLVSMILMRTLRKDYARYAKDEEMDDMVSVGAWELKSLEDYN
jgi:transmembrane 9 superfamily protein 3